MATRARSRWMATSSAFCWARSTSTIEGQDRRRSMEPAQLLAGRRRAVVTRLLRVLPRLVEVLRLAFASLVHAAKPAAALAVSTVATPLQVRRRAGDVFDRHSIERVERA